MTVVLDLGHLLLTHIQVLGPVAPLGTVTPLEFSLHAFFLRSWMMAWTKPFQGNTPRACAGYVGLGLALALTLGL